MMSPKEKSMYCSYLVRLWPEGDAWRATAENVHTGERRAFGDLNAFFVFIEQKTTEISKTEMGSTDLI